MSDRKVFAGAQLRRFRKGLGLTQARMADGLEISPSYLNLLERDQRPLSARVLLRLAEAYDLDLRSFSAEGGRELADHLRRAASDPVIEAAGLDGQDIADLIERHPRAADALVRLYGAYRGAAAPAHAPRLAHSPSVPRGATPLDAARDALGRASPYQPDLEAAAGAIFQRDFQDPDIGAALAARLQARHGQAVQLLPPDVMGAAVRRFDRHGRRVQISHSVDPARRAFMVAYHLAMLDGADAVSAFVDTLDLQAADARAFAQVAAGKYIAAAMLAPYERFYRAAETDGYDLDDLSARFGLSPSQTARRLCALRRPGKAGPAFMALHADAAGHVLSRAGPPTARDRREGPPLFGAACARWIAFDAGNTLRTDRVQLVETPDGARWVTSARLIVRRGGDPRRAGAFLTLVLVCPVEDAGRWRAAQALLAADVEADPIGPGCEQCERSACPVRGAPPRHRRVAAEPHDWSPTHMVVVDLA